MAKENTKAEILNNIQNMMSQVYEYANSVIEDEVVENNTLDSIANNHGLNINESIRRIASSDANTNKRLIESLEKFAGAINQGAYDECLCESYLSTLAQYKYLLPVQREHKRINEALKSNKESINIAKILEQMNNSSSYYIVPMIEEDAIRYAKNPTPMNRTQLRNILCSFAADPFCNQMLETIELDGKIITNSLDEKAMSIKDQIKVIRQNATVENIYSPVQYIKENESVFNVHGQFYVKKGNSLAKLNNAYIGQLSENFVTLCKLVNDPQVSISEDSITVVASNKSAKIFEDYAEINGNREDLASIKNMNIMGMKYDYDKGFYNAVAFLMENFNNIANINFAKHISLNEDRGVNADLFRIGDNIFINTINENIDKSTFYHNVNPIQCRNILNKHMDINVSAMFEDLLPSQDKIMLRLNETKNEYEASIEKYEATIEKLKMAKEVGMSEDSASKLDSAIETATKKVNELKKEYKEWQEQVEKNTKGKGKSTNPADDEVEDDTEVEPTNEPIDADEVEDAKPELQQPIGDGDSGANGGITFDDMDINAEDSELEDSDTITDDEFASYMDDSDSDSDSEEIDDEEVDGEELTEPDADIVPEDDEMETLTTNDDTEEWNEVDIDDEDSEIESGDEEVDMDIEDEDEDVMDVDMDMDIEDDEEIITDEDDDTLTLDDTDDEIIGDANPLLTDVPDGYKIAEVKFDQNIRTGELFKTGKVIVLTTMIGQDGKMYVQNEDYSFYIDEDGTPIIDIFDVPVALYNAISNAISNDEKYSQAVESGVESNDVDLSGAKNYISHEDLMKADEDEEDELAIEDEDDDDIQFALEDDEDDDIELSDDDTQFEVTTDTDDEFTLTASDEDEDEVDDEDEDALVTKASDLFDDIDDEDTEDALNNYFGGEEDVDAKSHAHIPTYKSGDTEIELPASNIDDTLIPEDDNEEAQDAVDEVLNDIVKRRRPALQESMGIVGMRPVFSKKRNGFFVNDGTIKPSKKKAAHVNEANDANIDSVDSMNNEAPVTMKMMRDMAMGAMSLASSRMVNLQVSDIKNVEGVQSFTISNYDTNYTIYCVDDELYFRPTAEYVEIISNPRLDDETKMECLRTSFEGDLLDCADVTNQQDGEFIIHTILSSLGVDAHGIQETVKIAKAGISSEGDFEKSKFVDDILHGDEERRDFEEKVERDTQKHGIDNPLAPSAQPQESLMILPNVNTINESDSKRRVTFQYQPMDWVIIKENGMKAQVYNVCNDGFTGKLTALTIIASDGRVYDCEPEEIVPDPLYMDNIAGRVINSQPLGVPRLGECDVDPKTRMSRKPENEAPIKMADLNGPTVQVAVVSEGKVMRGAHKALVEDIANSRRRIRVINEEEEVEEYDAIKEVMYKDFPYAVIVDGDGKPVRTIKIDPVSYINAGEDDMVRCICGTNETEFPKRAIDVLS